MKQVNWFERKFDFTVTNQNIMPAILERLAGTPLRMAFKVKFLRDDDCAIRMNNSWSIKEQIGHLSDLEPLWLGRIEDILSNREELRHADLENTKTTNANHNAKSLTQLVSDFEKSRQSTLDALKNLGEQDVFKYALHPRLKVPMRLIDLAYFVAEHDDHHLSKMSELAGGTINGSSIL